MALHLPPYRNYGKITLTDFAKQHRFWFLGLSVVTTLMVVMFRITSRLKRNLRESVLTNEERERARDFLQTVIDGLPEPLLVVDPDYTIALANRAATEMTIFHDPATGCLQSFRSSESNDSSPGIKHEACPASQVIESKATVVVDHIHRDTAGRQQLFEIVAAPIFDARGEVVQIIESFHDVSERRKAEEDLKRTKRL